MLELNLEYLFDYGKKLVDGLTVQIDKVDNLDVPLDLANVIFGLNQHCRRAVNHHIGKESRTKPLYREDSALPSR